MVWKWMSQTLSTVSSWKQKIYHIASTADFCLIFAKIGLSKLGSSQTDLFKGNKAETPVTSGLLVHQHHSIFHIAFNLANQTNNIFSIRTCNCFIIIICINITCYQWFLHSPNWRKYSRTSSVAVSWLTPPTKIFFVLLSLLLRRMWQASNFLSHLFFGVAGFGSIAFPSKRWEETDSTFFVIAWQLMFRYISNFILVLSYPADWGGRTKGDEAKSPTSLQSNFSVIKI